MYVLTRRMARFRSRSYRFAHITHTIRALQSSTKTSLRIEAQGLLSLQFLVPVPKARGGGTSDSFIEFRVCAARALVDILLCAFAVFAIGRPSDMSEPHHGHISVRGVISLRIDAWQTVCNARNSKVCINVKSSKTIRTSHQNMLSCYLWERVGQVQLMGVLCAQAERSQQ